jgi:hypothetical protein
MSDHIADRGQHRTLFDGEYANRVRSERHPPGECHVAAEPPRKRCSPSWARLIRKILDHLGPSTPEAENPPPQREVLMGDTL